MEESLLSSNSETGHHNQNAKECLLVMEAECWRGERSRWRRKTDKTGQSLKFRDLTVSLKVVELEQGAVELWEKGHDQGAVILPAKIWKWDYACVCVCWKQ